LEIQGGCYCGAVRYRATGEPILRGQCTCRECQYISGGNANFFMTMPEAGFTYTREQPKQFRRKDLENPVTREFCAECGTHLATRAPGLRGQVIVKVGSLDDPSVFGGPKLAVYTCDKQAFHQIPSGIPAFERVPG
jgi:hypothetical protein